MNKSDLIGPMQSQSKCLQTFFEVEIDIHTEMQRTQNSQNNLKKQNRRTNTT